MRLGKNGEANKVSDDAQKAWDSGRSVFTPVLNYLGFDFGFSGGNDELALMVEAILAVGWRLDTWNSVSDANGRPRVMPLFVRPGALIR